MGRLLAGLGGALIFVAPAWMLFSTMLPVPQYRTGTFEDYRDAVNTSLVLYGGAAAGILVVGWLAGRAVSGTAAFVAGFVGVLVTIMAVLLGPAAYGLLTHGASGLGNLWGLIVILGSAAGIVVAGGAGLVLYALHAPRPETR